MDVSPWLAMSVLQKAARRGREDLALGRRRPCCGMRLTSSGGASAASPSRTSGWRAWRLWASRRRRWRESKLAPRSAAIGRSLPVWSPNFAERPSAGRLDDLVEVCELHPAHAEARVELPLLTTSELITIATGQGDVGERALALWYALGTDRRPSILVSRPGEPRLVFNSLCEAGWPHSIVEVAREGFRRIGEILCPLVALLSGEPREPSRVQGDDLPPEMMIAGVPGWAMDVHTRQGRAAFARFLETDAPAAQWVRANIRPARRVPFFGHIVFRIESGLVVNRLRWPLGDELRRQADVECSYPNSTNDTEILELARADLPLLDEVRAEIAGGLSHAS